MSAAHGRKLARLALLGAVAALFGCQDDLPKATLIKHMRVIGARTEVIGDEQRSTPRPGERAVLNWSIVYPEYPADDSEIESLFLACTAPSRFTGTPVCQELIDAAQSGDSSPIQISGALASRLSCEGRDDAPVALGGITLRCLRGTPRLEVAIEPSFEAAAKLVQGIICRNGTPRLDLSNPVGVSCRPHAGVDEDEIESIPVYGTVPIAYEPDDENLNPDASRIELRLRVEYSDNSRGELWEPTPADELPDSEDDCAESGSVEPRDVNRELIALRYPAELGQEGQEALQFSTYATQGELSRRFTVLEPEDRKKSEAASEIEWELSQDERKSLIGESKLVRFYFTVMDGRGGFDATQRELCVTRP